MAANGDTVLRPAGSTGGVWALNTSSGPLSLPARRDSPPAQGCFQILGVPLGPQVLVQTMDKVVYVPVLQQLEFQQSFMILAVRQIQTLHSVPGFVL